MAKSNTKALSCTVDSGNFDRLAELRWAKRVETMSEMVNLAIAEYVDKHAPLPEPTETPEAAPEADAPTDTKTKGRVPTPA